MITLWYAITLLLLLSIPAHRPNQMCPWSFFSVLPRLPYWIVDVFIMFHADICRHLAQWRLKRSVTPLPPPSLCNQILTSPFNTNIFFSFLPFSSLPFTFQSLIFSNLYSFFFLFFCSYPTSQRQDILKLAGTRGCGALQGLGAAGRGRGGTEGDRITVGTECPKAPAWASTQTSYARGTSSQPAALLTSK